MLVLHSCGPFRLAKGGFPAPEPWGFVEAARLLCPDVFYREEQGHRALWECYGLSGRYLQTSAHTSCSPQTHEDHVWPEDHGMKLFCLHVSAAFNPLDFMLKFIYVPPCVSPPPALVCFPAGCYVAVQGGQRNSQYCVQNKPVFSK